MDPGCWGVGGSPDLEEGSAVAEVVRPAEGAAARERSRSGGAGPLVGCADGGGEKRRRDGRWTARRRARLASAAVEGGGGGARGAAGAGEVGESRTPRRKKMAAVAIEFILIAAAMNRRPQPTGGPQSQRFCDAAYPSRTVRTSPWMRTQVLNFFDIIIHRTLGLID